MGHFEDILFISNITPYAIYCYFHFIIKETEPQRLEGFVGVSFPILLGSLVHSNCLFSMKSEGREEGKEGREGISNSLEYIKART